MNARNRLAHAATRNWLIAAVALACALPQQIFAAGWEYTAEMYIWGAQMDVTTPGGNEAEMPFYQILDDLDMTFMGLFSARNEKWSLTADVIYLDISQGRDRDATFPDIGDVKVSGRVSLSSWIVTPTVGYALYNTDKARVEIIGGARYLDIDAGIRVARDGVVVFDESASEGYWDGIIGMRTSINLAEEWFMPVYFDVGAGGSDGTWQAMAGIGYRYGNWNTVLTYRYLDYQFDDNRALADLTIKGPLLGFGYTWR